MYEWTNELSVKFMEYYQSQPILWDPKLRGHKDKAKTNDAWTTISKELNIPIEELKNKKNSIMATFRGHLRKKRLPSDQELDKMRFISQYGFCSTRSIVF